MVEIYSNMHVALQQPIQPQEDVLFPPPPPPYRSHNIFWYSNPIQQISDRSKSSILLFKELHASAITYKIIFSHTYTFKQEMWVMTSDQQKSAVGVFV